MLGGSSLSITLSWVLLLGLVVKGQELGDLDGDHLETYGGGQGTSNQFLPNGQPNNLPQYGGGEAGLEYGSQGQNIFQGVPGGQSGSGGGQLVQNGNVPPQTISGSGSGYIAQGVGGGGGGLQVQGPRQQAPTQQQSVNYQNAPAQQFSNPVPPIQQGSTFQQFGSGAVQPPIPTVQPGNYQQQQFNSQVPSQAPPQYNNPVVQQIAPQVTNPIPPPPRQNTPQYTNSVPPQVSQQFIGPAPQQVAPQQQVSPQFTNPSTQQISTQQFQKPVLHQVTQQYTNPPPQQYSPQYNPAPPPQITPQFNNPSPVQAPPPQYNISPTPPRPQQPSPPSPPPAYQQQQYQPAQAPQPKPIQQTIQRPSPPSTVQPNEVRAPYPACPTSTFCVREEYCNAYGLIEEHPIRLSPADKLYRAGLVQNCSKPATGKVGVCCRDQNYNAVQNLILLWSAQPSHTNYLRLPNTQFATLASGACTCGTGNNNAITPSQRLQTWLNPSYYGSSSSILPFATSSLANANYFAGSGLVGGGDHLGSAVVSLPITTTRGGGGRPYGDHRFAGEGSDMDTSTGEEVPQQSLESRGGKSLSHFFGPRSSSPSTSTFWGRRHK